MLLLTRKLNEDVIIDGYNGSVTVRVCKIGRNRVTLGLDAPKSTLILRKELRDAERTDSTTNGEVHSKESSDE